MVVSGVNKKCVTSDCEVTTSAGRPFRGRGEAVLGAVCDFFYLPKKIEPLIPAAAIG